MPLPGALPPVLRHSMACPALPTCGLAITESERVLPEMVAAVQSELDAVGLGAETIHLRQTGCPNGCARPYTAEIGIVGQSVGMYTVYLGGSPLATRLGQVYRDKVPLAAIAPLLRPVFADFAKRAEVHSIAEPGYTDALEFDDGKIMLGKHQSLKQMNWENRPGIVGRGRRSVEATIRLLFDPKRIPERHKRLHGRQ